MFDKDITQLVIFALLFVGWVVKTALEHKKKPQTRRPPHVPRPPTSTPPTVPERGPAPRRRERLPESAGTTEAEEAPRAEPAPEARAATPTMSGTVEVVRDFARAAEVEGLAVGTLESATADITEKSARGRRALARRLGGSGDTTARDLARAGMLWSEVLGPPRGTRGPHRPPSVLRPER